MSNVMASTNPTLASSEEQSLREVDLHFDIETKLAQAKGICALICEVGGNEAVSEAASAAESLIEGVEKALAELEGRAWCEPEEAG